MNVKRIVGENIRGFRKKIEWTQEKLAVRSGINSEHISRIENGTENATIETLTKLAKELKIETYLLLIKDSHKRE